MIFRNIMKNKTFGCTENKNDSIHKAKLKKSDDQTMIDKYRVAANITEYIISKLISWRITIPKLMMIRQLF